LDTLKMVIEVSDVAICAADFDIHKLEDAAGFFNTPGFDLPQLQLTENWSDETPPETPCSNATSLPLVPAHETFLESFPVKVAETKDGEWEHLECSVMWNMGNSAQDPACKLFDTSASPALLSSGPSLSLSDDSLSTASSPFALPLFANEDIGGDEDIFVEFGGNKRKAAAIDPVEAKKAKNRQVRESLSPETHMRLMTSTGADSKRLTHNVLERKRRNDLKASYQELRESIPDLAHQERAPTAQILTKGHEYIESLKKTEAALMASIMAYRADIERSKAILIAAGKTPML